LLKYRALIVPISDSCQPRWLRIQKDLHESVGRIILLFHFTFCTNNFSVSCSPALITRADAFCIRLTLMKSG